jgi:hypothetical protein
MTMINTLLKVVLYYLFYLVVVAIWIVAKTIFVLASQHTAFRFLTGETQSGNTRKIWSKFVFPDVSTSRGAISPAQIETRRTREMEWKHTQHTQKERNVSQNCCFQLFGRRRQHGVPHSSPRAHWTNKNYWRAILKQAGISTNSAYVFTQSKIGHRIAVGILMLALTTKYRANLLTPASHQHLHHLFSHFIPHTFESLLLHFCWPCLVVIDYMAVTPKKWVPLYPLVDDRHVAG